MGRRRLMNPNFEEEVLMMGQRGPFEEILNRSPCSISIKGKINHIYAAAIANKSEILTNLVLQSNSYNPGIV